MALEPIDIGMVRDLTYRQSGIVISTASEYLVEARLGPLATELGLAGVPALIQRLREREWSELHGRVVEAMTTNETSFFRDQHPFDALRDHILPGLIRARSEQRKLAFWCAACSSGQEVYSLLMLLREHFPELHGWDVTVWATDYSAEMVDRTRAGVFNQHEIGRGLPIVLRDRYFRPAGTDWRAAAELRSALRLRTLNLTETFPPLPKFDLVMMRNVLIYFDLETKRKILRRVAALLRPDSLLLLGATETTLNVDDRLESVRIGLTPCFRVLGASDGAAAAGRAQPSDPVETPTRQRGKRYVMRCVAEFECAAGAGRGVLVDLSASGARLDWVHPPLAVGDRLALRVHLLGKEPAWQVEAEVARATPTGVAVRFLPGPGLSALLSDMRERMEREPSGRSGAR